VKALTSEKAYTEKMRKEYGRRRKLILKRIEEIPSLQIEVKPEGAFYVFPRITCKNEVSSKRFAEYMLKEAKVLVVPGNEFGSNGEGFIRMSYATKYEIIEKALDRIEKASKPICET
jgi:aspartate/methionine/tyrosine aminotransferase